MQAVLLAWLCTHHRLRLQNLNMVVDLLEYLSGGCRTGMITTSQKMLVEWEEEAVEQIHLLQFWRAYLVLFLRILPLCCAIFHCRLWVMFKECQWSRQYRCSVLYVI